MTIVVISMCHNGGDLLGSKESYDCYWVKYRDFVGKWAYGGILSKSGWEN